MKRKMNSEEKTTNTMMKVMNMEVVAEDVFDSQADSQDDSQAESFYQEDDQQVYIPQEEETEVVILTQAEKQDLLFARMEERERMQEMLRNEIERMDAEEQERRRTFSRASEEEMQEAYEYYQKLLAEDREKMERENVKKIQENQEKLTEIKLWIGEGHLLSAESLEDRFKEMCDQREEIEREKIRAWSLKNPKPQIVLKAEPVVPKVFEPKFKAPKRNQEESKVKNLKPKAAASEGRRAKRAMRPALPVVESKIETVVAPIEIEDSEEEVVEIPAESEPVVAYVPQNPDNSFLDTLATKVEEKKAEETRAENAHNAEKESWTLIAKKPSSRKVSEVSIVSTHSTERPSQHTSSTCTRFCRSVFENSPCPNQNCTFAHSAEQLVQMPCRFAERCRNIKARGAGVYTNTSDFVCRYWHPQESCNSYAKRQGVNLKVAEETKQSFKLPPPAAASKPFTKPAGNPWQKPAQSPAFAPSPMPVVANVVAQSPVPRVSRWAPPSTPVPATPQSRPSRWAPPTPVQRPMTPINMTNAFLEALARGDTVININ